MTNTIIKGPWHDCANHLGRKSSGRCPNCKLWLCVRCLAEHEALRRIEGDCHG